MQCVLKKLPFWMATLVLGLCLACPLAAQDKGKEKAAPTVVPLAVLPFQDRGAKDMKMTGGKVTDLLFAELVANPDLYLVEREDLAKVLAEHELNLSGATNPDQAIQVGQLTGAKVLVTGSVVQVESNLYLVAKIIGTETTRVHGASVKGKTDDDLGRLVEKLASEIATVLGEKSDQLIAKPVTKEDRLAALKKTLGEKTRPSVVVSIKERHVSQATIDPAAETEVEYFAKESGFKVLDRLEGDKSEADVLLVGEGFSELGGRIGNLASVKARLELKAIDRRTGKVLAVDRQTTVALDLTEQVAGKTALQDAAARISERLLAKLGTEGAKKKGKK